MEEGASVKIFKLVKVKDRITVDPDDGYRDICLNVEVESTPTSSLLCALWYSVDCIVDSMMGIRTDSQTQSLAHWKWRLIWLFLQVAWTILSESSDQLEFVPVLNEYGVSMWNNRSQIRTHVCEVLRCFLILFACSYDGLTNSRHYSTFILADWPHVRKVNQNYVSDTPCILENADSADTGQHVQTEDNGMSWAFCGSPKPPCSIAKVPRIAGRTNWRDPWISRRVITAARNHINLHPKVWFFSVGRMVHALNFHNYSHTDVPERYEDGSR